MRISLIKQATVQIRLQAPRGTLMASVFRYLKRLAAQKPFRGTPPPLVIWFACDRKDFVLRLNCINNSADGKMGPKHSVNKFKISTSGTSHLEIIIPPTRLVFRNRFPFPVCKPLCGMFTVVATSQTVTFHSHCSPNLWIYGDTKRTRPLMFCTDAWNLPDWTPQ